MTASDPASRSATPFRSSIPSETRDTEPLETLALDQHQERWSLALLPFITVMIVVAGATFLFTLIDLGSANHLSLESQPAQNLTKTVQDTPATDGLTGANTNKTATASPKDKQSKETANSPAAASKTPDSTPNMVSNVISNENSKPSAAYAPMYPLLQSDEVREPFALAQVLAKDAADFKAPVASATVPLSFYLWSHFDDQTKLRLRHVHDVGTKWPPARVLVHSQAASQYSDDITSPAYLRTILTDALNKQLDDEAIAIRFQSDRWLAEARRVMEQKGEPEFHPERIKNPRRLARQIKDIPAGKLNPALQRRIVRMTENRAAQGEPDFSPQEILAGKQALAAKLNVLLYGDSLCSQEQFSDACSSLPILLKPPVRSLRVLRPPKEADTTLLANRVLLEQTYADYLDKAEPALPQDTLRRLNRAALMRLYPSLGESPDPVPTADVIAERQSGRLAWFTYVGLNFAVCLCVFFAAGGIILAAAQVRYYQAAVPRLSCNEVNFKQLLALLQKDAPPFHRLLRNLVDANCYAEILKHPLDSPDELPRNLQDGLIQGLNRLIAGFSLTKNDKLQLTWKQKMREILPFAHLSTEHSVEIYKNLRQIIEFDPAWVTYSDAQKQQIRERLGTLEKQSRLSSHHRGLLPWLLLVLSAVSLRVIVWFPIDKGTFGGFLAITAQRDMTYLHYLVALFEKVELTALLLLAFATCMVLMPPSEEDKEALTRRARSLSGPSLQHNLDDEVALWYAGKMQNLRAILYISTAVLASAVLQVSFTYSWALTYLPYPHGDVYKQFELLARTIITARGIYYSLLLASIYLPATFVLRSLTTTLAEEAWRHRAKAQGTQSSEAKEGVVSAMPAPVTMSAPAAWIQRMVSAWQTWIGKKKLEKKKQMAAAIPSQASSAITLPLGETAEKPGTAGTGNMPPFMPNAPDNTLDSREKWLKERALSSETWEMLPRFAAVILPLLTGPAAEIIKNLIPSIGSK